MPDSVPDTLFRCEYFAKHFTFAACRRRQGARNPDVVDDHGELLACGLPIYRWCASGRCAQGREVAAALEAAGIARPAPERLEEPQVSKRIWSGEVPDVPIGPPPATSKYSGYRSLRPAGFQTMPREQALADQRTREAAARKEGAGASPAPTPAEPPDQPALSAQPHGTTTSDVVQASAHAAPAPASPAKEATMAEKTCSKCGKELRADNSTGACGDRKACAARAGKAPTNGAAKQRAASPERSRSEKRSGHGLGPLDGWDFDGWDVEDLLAARENIDEELGERRIRARQEVEKINTALDPTEGKAA